MNKKRGLILVVLGLFFLFLILLSAQAETGGCYIYSKASEDFYCQSGVLESEAKIDCDSHPDCLLKNYFYPGEDCSLPKFETVCKSVTCTIDCQTHALGKCQELGGAEIPENDVDWWCNPGCCKIEKANFCQANLLRSACELKAQQKAIDPAEIFFDNSLGMNTEKCNDACKLEIKKSNLTIVIKDQSGQTIPKVIVTLEGLKKTGAETDELGKYTFSDLMPGTFLITLSKENYNPKSSTLAMKAGEVLEQEFVLTALEGQILVLGTILDKEGKTISGTTFSWKGTTAGIVSADASGKYQTPKLPAGDYIFTASAPGYKKQEIQKTLDLAKPEMTFPFALEKGVLQVIKVKTYQDIDGDNKLDYNVDKTIFGAKIYLGGVFKGYSKSPDGSYELEFSLVSGQEETHNISATFQDLSSEPVIITLVPGEAGTQDLLLTTYKGECTEPGTEKNVEELVAVPVPGEKKIKLSWNKPCPEVIAYEIKRMKSGTLDDTEVISPLVNEYPDPRVEWGEEYTYQIVAFYDQDRESQPTISNSVKTGNKFCEGQYNSEIDKWNNFCIVDTDLDRKIVWSCDNQNQLITNSNCQESGPNYFCAKISKEEAVCKDAGFCNNPLKNLFGLYYQKETCYGVGNQNFCFYDFPAKTQTIVDQCQSCTKIKSCFDYRSKDACEIDNCLGSTSGTKCQWVNGAANNLLIDYQLILPGLVTPETGTGYCTEKDYQDDDQCSLCSPRATLFENYFCTADICSALGRCFSLPELRECRACEDYPSDKSNCYNYGTEFECTNKKAGITKGIYGEIDFSEDRCGWERCFWQGIPNGPGSCIKDGDGDFTDGNTDECSSFDNPNLNLACKIDNSAPKTRIDPEGVNVVSYATPTLTFIGQDNFHESELQNNALGVLGICLESIDPTQPVFCTREKFIEKSYPGKQKEEQLVINLINSTFLQTNQINGETYRLKYYSKDKYFNQEKLQTAYVFVDNVLPQFEINEINTTIGDVTTLTVFLEKTEEKMECTFKLDQLIPKGESRVEVVPIETIEKKVVFEGLQGVSFNLNVSCQDKAGNINSKLKSYIFNLDQDIQIIYPEFNGIINQLEIIFKVKTTVGSTCGLYLTATNEKVADLVTNEEGKEHQTSKIPGFYEKEYNGEYKAICKEFFADKTHEALFQFKLDFTPPETQIILKEGSREEKPLALGLEEWELYFIKLVQVSFECQAEGFGCDKTHYCLGDNCNFIQAPGYLEYQPDSPLELTNTTKICYYSTDLGKNTVYNPVCGKIVVDGYGITLISPEPYYYQNEVFGVSNQPKFDWKFSTRVPTSECRFDYISDFDYDSIPKHKTKVPEESAGQYIYLFENFPESVLSDYPEDGGIKAVYLQCKNLEGEIGPEQKFNLEYDSSIPNIIQAYAQPNKILEGTTTNLFTETDDKTLCKYSDNSESQGSSEYQTMEYSFPGTEEKLLDLMHQDIFEINFVSSDGKKNYFLNTQCKNGAGDLSELKIIDFSVDYAEKGYLVDGSLQPNGYITSKTVAISAETSKKAYCEYDLGDGSGQTPFDNGQNDKVHTSILENLEEKEYLIPVKCIMGDHQASGQIKFTVDLTPPKIDKTDDGNKTCGSELIKLFVYTNEEKINLYYYEVYDLGDFSSSLVPKSTNKSQTSQTNSTALGTSGQKTMIASATVNVSQPLEISTSNLNSGHKYNFKIKAQDMAGNWGDLVESDGIFIVPQNYSACTEDKSTPEITFSMNDSSCTKTLVEMNCKDATQCKFFNYLQKADSKGCVNLSNSTFLNYNGQKLEFAKSGWICYNAGDPMGNNKTGTKDIVFPDGDGDGIRDKCDQCQKTGAGKVVDKNGCTSDEVSEIEKQTDTDGDKLPDAWEKLQSQDGCELNYLSKDSDDNGITDDQEDYDQDGVDNYGEYLGMSDPCVADAKKKAKTTEEEEEEEKKKEEKKPVPTPPAKEADVLAWIFLILGLLLSLGGTGYLIYYYLYSPQGKGGKRGLKPSVGFAPSSAKPSPITDLWKTKILGLKKAREEKLKARRKDEIFGKFSSASKEFPHIGDLLQKKAISVSQLGKVAQKYAEHKEEIQPGLKREEKGIFSKLEEISKQQAKGGKVSEVVSQEEAEDIFAKLKNISKKRKGGKND